jgi:hypothetical protein
VLKPKDIKPIGVGWMTDKTVETTAGKITEADFTGRIRPVRDPDRNPMAKRTAGRRSTASSDGSNLLDADLFLTSPLNNTMEFVRQNSCQREQIHQATAYRGRFNNSTTDGSEVRYGFGAWCLVFWQLPQKSAVIEGCRRGQLFYRESG